MSPQIPSKSVEASRSRNSDDSDGIVYGELHKQQESAVGEQPREHHQRFPGGGCRVI